MSLQYTILSALIRPEIKEKISIGIIMFDKVSTYSRFSKEKLNICRELLSDTGFKLLKDVLADIDKNALADQPNSLVKGTIFPFDDFNKQIFTKEYIGYLSVYSNNTISFSEPREINLPFSPESVNKLFEKYVSIEKQTLIKPAKSYIKLFDVIKRRYKGKIDKIFDISKEVTHEIVPNLITPITIDFIGRNGIDVFVQTLDMEQTPNVISNHINGMFQLKSVYNSNKVEMKDFVVAKEPSKELLKQHDIWNQIRSQKIINYLDISESDKIIEYAESKGVKPLLSTKSTNDIV